MGKFVGGNSKALKSEMIEAAEHGQKVPIYGGHGDANRMLKAHGLPELYAEEDESKHHGHSKGEGTPSAEGDWMPSGMVVNMRENKLSPKEEAMLEVMMVVPHRGTKLLPVKGTVYVDTIPIREFDRYVIDRGWLVHAARLRSPRTKPIVTAFAKYFSYAKLVKMMKQIIKATKRRAHREWEEREFKELCDAQRYWGTTVPVRGLFFPPMYLARTTALYLRKFYPTQLENWRPPSLPNFRPLSKLSDVEVRADARHANVGLPILKRLSEKGVDYKSSPVYLQVLENGAKFEEDALYLKKVTNETAATLSPPHVVFDRAQSGGRGVVDVSKTVAFPLMRIIQPLQEKLEALDWYLSGDELSIMRKIDALFDRKVDSVANGDDLGSRLGGLDASSFESSLSAAEIEAWISAVCSNLGDRDARVGEVAMRAIQTVEWVNSVGIAKIPFDGVRSGDPGTHVFETVQETRRAEKALAKARDFDTWLKRMSKFGIYREEYRCNETEFAIMGKAIHYAHEPTLVGSGVRVSNSCWQRESPVLTDRSEDVELSISTRTVQVLSKYADGDAIDLIVREIKNSGFEIRGERATLLEGALELGTSQVKESGEYARTCISKILDLFGK